MKIEITNLNETFIKIISDNNAVYDALQDKFSFEVPGFRFMPSYRDGSWDGKIRLFNWREKTIYKGLFKEVVSLLKSDDYGEISLRGFTKKEDLSDAFDAFYKKLEKSLTLKPYDYQYESAREICLGKKSLVISPTSSGKSLIIYIVSMFFLHMTSKDEKLILIVPSLTLVDQMFEDFKSYGYEGDAHLIVGGSKKDSDKRLYISTWQSIQNQNRNWFNKFVSVIVDEVHGATAKALKSSVENCTNAAWRAGFTGTLSDFEANELILQGLFGKKIIATTYQEMRELGIIPDVDIELVKVKYSNLYGSLLKAIKGDYDEEVAFVHSVDGRDELLLKIAKENQDKNGIFLFKSLNHIKRVEKLFKKSFDRPVLVINGGTAREVRAQIRRMIDEEALNGFRGFVILATYGTMSTGVSIKNLDYGVFAEPMKSKIKVLQSLGRLLRKSTSKLHARLYDIWDDFSEYTGKDNFGKAHAKSRLNFYTEAGFDISESSFRVE